MFLGTPREALLLKRVTTAVKGFMAENPDVQPRDIFFSLLSLTYATGRKLGWSLAEMAGYCYSAWQELDIAATSRDRHVL